MAHITCDHRHYLCTPYTDWRTGIFHSDVAEDGEGFSGFAKYFFGVGEGEQ